MGWGYNGYGQLNDGNYENKYMPVEINGVSNVKQIESDGYCIIAVLNDGTVKTWGANWMFSLTVDGVIPDYIPATTVPNLTNVKEVSLNMTHILILLNDGTVKSCGDNNGGELGYTTADTYTVVPNTITGLTNVKSVATGYGFSLALLNDGTVKSWGNNWAGQLGYTTADSFSTVPTTIANLNSVISIKGGGNQAYALLSSGQVKDWGDNSAGQLGLGSSGNCIYTPTLIPNLTNVKQIESENESCLALLSNGVLKAFGRNSWGELGNGTFIESNVPITVNGISNVSQITQGSNNSLALFSDGTVKTWGIGIDGELGSGYYKNYANIPTDLFIEADTYAPTISFSVNGGNMNNIFVTALDKGIGLNWSDIKYCWSTQNSSAPTSGWNNMASSGVVTRSNLNSSEYLWVKSGDLLGNSQTSVSNIFTPYTLYPVKLSAGWTQTIALMSDGSVKMWGITTGDSDVYGRIKYLPVTINGLSNVTQISSGMMHCLALLSDGTVKAWGENGFGELGVGNNLYYNTPVTVPNLTNVKAVAAGTSCSAALLNDGTLKVWGWNLRGELGDGTTTSSYSPKTVEGLTNVKYIRVINTRMIAVLNDGTVKSWGQNYSGEFGEYAWDTLRPMTVANLANATDIQAGFQHTLLQYSDGTLKACGDNGYGELGDGTNTTRATVLPVSNVSNVKQIAANGYSSYALMNDGTVKAWGYNGEGQLGDGTTTDIYTPKIVTGTTNVKEIVAGTYSLFTMLNDGTVKGCGQNYNGQIGLGNTSTTINLTTLPKI